VVYGEDGRNVGLVVDHILDIVDESYALDVKTARPGVAARRSFNGISPTSWMLRACWRWGISKGDG